MVTADEATQPVVDQKKPVKKEKKLKKKKEKETTEATTANKDFSNESIEEDPEIDTIFEAAEGKLIEKIKKV